MKKLSPKPHQTKAIRDNIYGEYGLLNANRATYVSACATGKTLSGLWTTEEYLLTHVENEYKLAVFFFPSLALISQSYVTFKEQNSLPGYNPLVVCSETKIGKVADDPEDTPDDAIIYATCTDVQNVIGYLRDDTIQNKVIFVTYHSAPIVAAAMLSVEVVADVGVFDEAHRTAQNGGAENMAYALLDENFPIRKRLFMTATPKHIATSEYDSPAQFSMDNTEVYGHISHELPMRQAIQEGLIADYAIVAGAMESKEEIDENNAISVIAEAFIRAVRKTGVKTVIAFQKNIAMSKAFTEWVDKHYPDVHIRHIDGTMSHNERESVMRFLKSGRGIRIVTNARLLSEGVDVPSVDMVAFLANTESEIDIVQRVGRAQRIAVGMPGKIGYVFIPIITNPEREIIFGEEGLLNVISNLRENDEQLRVEVDAISKTDNPSKKVIVLDLNLSEEKDGAEGTLFLPSLQKRINAVLIGGAIRKEWDEVLKDTVCFIEQNKRHPSFLIDNERWLAAWLAAQKTKFNLNTLSPSRKKMLMDKLGEDFFLPTNEKRWLENFEMTVAYYQSKKSFPSMNVSQRLSSWVTGQRRMIKEGLLPQDKLEKIKEAFGDKFLIDMEERWNEKLGEVKAYFEKHGKLPSKKDKISSWIGIQRSEYKNGTLSQERVRLIVDIFGDLFFKPKEECLNELWASKFSMCKAFYSTFGKLPTAAEPNKNDKALGVWLKNQRLKKDAGKLEQDKIDLLIAHFKEDVFDSNKDIWMKHLDTLADFFNKHKRWPSPSKNKEEGFLNNWSNINRKRYLEGKLETEEMKAMEQKLDKSFFVTKEQAIKEQFIKMVNKLEEHILLFGRYPNTKKESSKNERGLVAWINKNRIENERGKLEDWKSKILHEKFGAEFFRR